MSREPESNQRHSEYYLAYRTLQSEALPLSYHELGGIPPLDLL